MTSLEEKQLVLYHRYPGGAESLRVQPRSGLNLLVDHAQPGDSLHKVPLRVCQEPPLLFEEVRRQRASGEFVPI